MLKNSDYVKFAKQIPKIETMQKDYDFCKEYIIENGNLYDVLKLKEKEDKKLKKKNIASIFNNLANNIKINN